VHHTNILQGQRSGRDERGPHSVDNVIACISKQWRLCRCVGHPGVRSVWVPSATKARAPGLDGPKRSSQVQGHEELSLKLNCQTARDVSATVCWVQVYRGFRRFWWVLNPVNPSKMVRLPQNHTSFATHRPDDGGTEHL
jgi:hypothetical protein